MALQDNKRLNYNYEIEICDFKYPHVCPMLGIPLPIDVFPHSYFWLFLWIFMGKKVTIITKPLECFLKIQ